MAGENGSGLGDAGGELGGNAGGTSGNTGGDNLAGIFGDGTVSVDPAKIGTSGGDQGGPGEGAKKRGRPRGSKTRTSQTASRAIDLAGVEKLLVTITAILAGFTGAKEWELDEPSATKIAEATARVARHYPVLDKVGDKAIDHVNFLSCVGGEAGMRIMAWRMRKATENASKPQPDNVTAFNPAHGRTV